VRKGQKRGWWARWRRERDPLLPMTNVSGAEKKEKFEKGERAFKDLDGGKVTGRKKGAAIRAAKD